LGSLAPLVLDALPTFSELLRSLDGADFNYIKEVLSAALPLLPKVTVSLIMSKMVGVLNRDECQEQFSNRHSIHESDNIRLSFSFFLT
jgi:hypothetical protein